MVQLAFRPTLALALSLVGCSPQSADAAEVGPSVYQPQLAAVVGRYLQDYHYLHPKLDDSLSQEWLDNYIDTLDYGHMVFLQSDVDALKAKYGKVLDDDLKFKSATVEPAFGVFNLYTQRLAERTATALDLLGKPVDFTADEVWHYDREDAPFPKTAAEATELWRLRIKNDLLQGELAGKKREEQVEMLRKRYSRTEKELEAFEPADVLEIYLGALTRDLDPHSTWFKPASNEDFDIDMSNSVEGIGATLATEDEYTVVKALVPGGPAELSGLLHENDKIVAVAQEGQQPQDIIDLRIDKVVKQIRGPKGSKVRLTIIPFDATDPSQTKVIEITRDKVAITSQDAQAHLFSVPPPSGPAAGAVPTRTDPLSIGVINVPSFYLDSDAKEAGQPDFNSTTHDVRDLIGQLSKQGLDVLVIDLRENGGGSLSEAVDLTGLFIDHGPVVQIKDQAGKMEAMADEDQGVAWAGPLVVLTDEGSASASEIFAGAIQDYGRGLIVGSPTTHGKGSVQTVMDVDGPLRAIVPNLPDEDTGGALKLTTHKFYRISGSSTQLKGVAADVVIPSPWEGLEIAEKDLDHALPWDTVQPVAHADLGHPASLAPQLQQAANARIASSQWFRWMAEDVAEREKEDADKTLSLNLEKRKAEKAAMDARNAERGIGPSTAADPTTQGDAEEQKKSQPKGPPLTTGKVVWSSEPKEDARKHDKGEDSPDFRLDESLAVARDYAVALGQSTASR